MINSWLMLFTMAVFIGGVALSVIFFLLKKGIAIKLLGLYTLTLALGIAEPLLRIYSFSQKAITYYGAISFLYGPLLFLYVRYACMGRQGPAIKDLIHFIPASAYVLLVVIQPANPAAPNEDALAEVILDEFFVFHVLIYTLKAVSIFRRPVADRSDDDAGKMKYAFIRNLVIFSAILFGSSIVFTHVFLLARTFPIPVAFQTYIQLGGTFMILLIAFLNTDMAQPKRMTP